MLLKDSSAKNYVFEEEISIMGDRIKRGKCHVKVGTYVLM